MAAALCPKTESRERTLYGREAQKPNETWELLIANVIDPILVDKWKQIMLDSTMAEARNQGIVQGSVIMASWRLKQKDHHGLHNLTEYLHYRNISICRGQRTTLWSGVCSLFSLLQFLGIKLRLSGLPGKLLYPLRHLLALT